MASLPCPAALASSPRQERTGTPVFSQRLDMETVPVLPLLVNVHVLLTSDELRSKLAMIFGRERQDSI